MLLNFTNGFKKKFKKGKIRNQDKYFWLMIIKIFHCREQLVLIGSRFVNPDNFYQLTIHSKNFGSNSSVTVSIHTNGFKNDSIFDDFSVVPNKKFEVWVNIHQL